jgi:hypothetical protein
MLLRAEIYYSAGGIAKSAVKRKVCQRCCEPPQPEETRTISDMIARDFRSRASPRFASPLPHHSATARDSRTRDVAGGRSVEAIDNVKDLSHDEGDEKDQEEEREDRDWARFSNAVPGCGDVATPCPRGSAHPSPWARLPLGWSPQTI